MVTVASLISPYGSSSTFSTVFLAITFMGNAVTAAQGQVTLIQPDQRQSTVWLWEDPATSSLLLQYREDHRGDRAEYE